MELNVRDLSAVKDKYFLVDVRTKTEFQQGSIPGSINLPLFDEAERDKIGLLYANNHQKANLLAMDIIAPRIPQYIRNLCQRAQGQPILVFCWRGGMRSHSVMAFLRMVGLAAIPLKGGYHQYRRQVYRQLQEFDLKQKIVVLRGKTGVGKTELLKHLKVWGYPAIDLEGLARHRGSSFGSWQGETARSQKDFDALLLEALKNLEGSYLILEGESRRIGNVCLPGFLYSAMKEATIIQVAGSTGTRIQRILREYLPQTPETRLAAYCALFRIRQRFPQALLIQLRRLLDRKDYRQFVELILSKYYDLNYNHRLNGKDVLLTINSDSAVEAAKQIATTLEKHAPSW